MGTIRSIGAPLVFSVAPRMSKPMPIRRSPLAACTQGAEPEWRYCATFWCSASMNFQPASSPIMVSQPAIVR